MSTVPRMTSVGRLAGTLTLAGLAGALQACAPIEPWVKPYERERLADPIMQLSRDTLAERHRDHVFTVREGARGATGVQGGGCGCN
jgi:Domain of unknown function (DUF4266)